MTNEEAINELLQCYSLYSPFKTAKKTNEAISMAIKALEETHTLNDNTLTIKVSEEDIDNVKRVMLDCAPWCRTFYEDAKDINVPSKSALDHIHNVVRDDAYRRGYEQGKADAAPKWIPVTQETLPEKGKVVVVYGDGRTWDVGMYKGHGNDINLWHWKKNTFKWVYWWMYKDDALPPQPKGE